MAGLSREVAAELQEAFDRFGDGKSMRADDIGNVFSVLGQPTDGEEWNRLPNQLANPCEGLHVPQASIKHCAATCRAHCRPDSTR